MEYVMQLSIDTIKVLKNFGVINQGIFFKQGKVLKTMSSGKNILAEVTIKEDIPTEFGIYDLNKFLSVVSLHKDNPTFEFGDKEVKIVGNKGRSKMKYRFCEPTMIVTPPEKPLTMPDAEISITLNEDTFNKILRTASVLASPQVAIESDGTLINVSTLDTQNDSAHTNTIEIAAGDSNKYRMIFKTENLAKILPGSYDVKISSKGISSFKNKNVPLQYWISTEQGSKFN
jgi:hypothetical protein